MWVQRQLQLAPRGRGFHLITRDVLAGIPEIEQIRVGLLHVFILHTSASLTINESASPDVRVDLEHAFDRLAPEDHPAYTHTDEGSDDMPAHIKASLLGPSLTIPVSGGRLVLGTWQGIQLAEHRDHGGARSLVVTLHGDAGD
jgi:secondary thiamine-phosphate synthase enzyme